MYIYASCRLTPDGDIIDIDMADTDCSAMMELARDLTLEEGVTHVVICITVDKFEVI